MISTGSRRPTASTPLTTPSRHPKATPMPAARKGSIPLRIASAATTAEKLNIHPIDRSISRIASRNTMPRARMPTKVLLADRLSSVLGSTNAGRTAPTSATNTARATMTPSSSGSRRRRGCGRGRIRSVTSRTDDSRVVASVPPSRSSTMVSSLDPIPRESPLHRAARQRRTSAIVSRNDDRTLVGRLSTERVRPPGRHQHPGGHFAAAAAAFSQRLTLAASMSRSLATLRTRYCGLVPSSCPFGSSNASGGP